MAADRIVDAQPEIGGGSDRTWERWTVDEMTDELVRVLVSRAQRAGAAADLSARLLHAPEDASTTADRSAREEAARIESAPAAEAWSDEEATVVPRAALEPFLRRRSGKPGLPGNRPLREGDVFWILRPVEGPAPSFDGPARSAPLTPGYRPASELLAALDAPDADVWDVTPAARDAGKRAYLRALGEAGDATADGTNSDG